MNISHAEIIDSLGGATLLANHLGINKHTVHSWRSNGIPAKIQLEYPEIIVAGRQVAEIRARFYGGNLS